MQSVDTDANLELRLFGDSPDEDAAGLLGVHDTKSPLPSVLAIAGKLGSTHAILESDYIDFAWRDEYSAFYSTLFRQYPSTSTRVLLMKGPPDAHSLEDLLSHEATQCVGFSVLRPTDSFRVGRTLVAPAPADTSNVFVPCRGLLRVHVRARTFDVAGFPFIQQDSQVMRCAQACLFSCMLYQQILHGEQLSLPHEISEVATREFSQLGRPFPSVGLTIEEMANFLVRTGYGALLHASPTRDEYSFDPLCCVPYVSSRVPALLCTKNHVVAAVGYVLDLARPTPIGPVVPLTRLVSHLIVNDDSRGPYRFLRQTPVASSAGGDLTPVGDELDFGTGRVDAVIIPSPKRMYLRASDALILAEEVLKDPNHQAAVTEWLMSEKAPMAEAFLSGLTQLNDRCITDAVLTKSQKLREFASASRGQMPDVLADAIVQMPLPRLTWVVEVTSLTRLQAGDTTVLGHIVFDATASRYESPAVLVHLPGFLIKGGGQSADFIDILGDVPSPSFAMTLRQRQGV